MMLADMTTKDNKLYDQALFDFDADGIPYNILVTPNGPSIEFPTVITPGAVKGALGDAKSPATVQ